MIPICLISHWLSLEMRCDFHIRLYDGDAGILGNKSNFCATTRGRYYPKTHDNIFIVWLCALVRWGRFFIVCRPFPLNPAPHIARINEKILRGITPPPLPALHPTTQPPTFAHVPHIPPKRNVVRNYLRRIIC